VLTAHGCFQHYLFKRRRAVDSNCVYCEASEDTAEHTIFNCTHWSSYKEEISGVLSREPRPEDVENLLCSPMTEQLLEDRSCISRTIREARARQFAFVQMAEEIMRQKEEDERRK